MRTRSKATIAAAVLLLVTAVAAVFLLGGDRGQSTEYRLARVERAPMVSKISSTGTLNAVITVQVGTQVSGQIKELTADFNSEVHAGQVIARIDPQLFEVRLQQAEADLAVARANVAVQSAGLERARTELENAEAMHAANKAQTEKASAALLDARRNLDRKQALFKKKVISESQSDEAQTAYEQAAAQLKSTQAQERAEASLVAGRQAAVKIARAQLDNANAQVQQRLAALEQSRVDLEHTVIRSPVDGVVIERSVDIGQTVAASLQAPKLFVIARDLRDMQVETDVDEADIGRIRVGQKATFTVDAFSGQEFNGQVLQIRKAPHEVQNVVTYTVLVSAANPDLRLLPGMTANVDIVVDQRPAVLKIPNAALRFQPPDGKGEAVSATDVGAAAKTGSGDPRQAGERLKRLAEALDLNADQKNRIRAIFSEMRQRIMTLRQQGAEPEEIRTTLEKMREKTRSEIAATLSPRQLEIFRNLSEAQPAMAGTRRRVWVLDDKGQPVPRAVTVGISDGNYTELIGDQLQEGQQVIVATNPVSRRSSAGILGRFGL